MLNLRPVRLRWRESVSLHRFQNRNLLKMDHFRWHGVEDQYEAQLRSRRDLGLLPQVIERERPFPCRQKLLVAEHLDGSERRGVERGHEGGGQADGGQHTGRGKERQRVGGLDANLFAQLAVQTAAAEER
jgi:hypothetical protein